jgi:hypothetical protein
MHVAFQNSHVYDYAGKKNSSRIMKVQMFVPLEKAKPNRKYKRLKLGGGQAYGH